MRSPDDLSTRLLASAALSCPIVWVKFYTVQSSARRASSPASTPPPPPHTHTHANAHAHALGTRPKIAPPPPSPPSSRFSRFRFAVYSTTGSSHHLVIRQKNLCLCFAVRVTKSALCIDGGASGIS